MSSFLFLVLQCQISEAEVKEIHTWMDFKVVTWLSACCGGFFSFGLLVGLVCLLSFLLFLYQRDRAFLNKITSSINTNKFGT